MFCRNKHLKNQNTLRMKKIIFIYLFLLCSFAGFSATWQITNVDLTFSPSSVTIESGDDVNFSITSIHFVVEVDQATWNANGATPLPGGFSTGFGGGAISASRLAAGNHYYVCGVHYSLGMKGIIIVSAATGISENNEQLKISVFPNPASDILTVLTDPHLIGSNYSLTNQAGRQILKGKINSEIFSINISQFEKGVYLLRSDGQKRRYCKVIKN